MTRTFAVRMDARKYDTVARLARQRRTTVSEAVREALEAWIDQARGAVQKLPYAAVADLLGIIERRRPRSAVPSRRRAPGRHR
jgi:ribbon-helix-helix CopG family protein